MNQQRWQRDNAVWRQETLRGKRFYSTLITFATLSLCHVVTPLPALAGVGARFILADFEGPSLTTNGGGVNGVETLPHATSGNGDNGTVTVDTTESASGRQCAMHVQAGGRAYPEFNAYNYNGIKTGVTSPRGFVREYADNPSGWQFNTYNRFAFWIKSPVNGMPLAFDSASGAGKQNIELGFYVKQVTPSTDYEWTHQDEAGGNHYYHFLNIPPTGTWTRVIVNMHPNHQRLTSGSNANGNTEWGNQPYPTCPNAKRPDGTPLGWGYLNPPPAECGQFNYWDAFTRFYFEHINTPTSYPATYKYDGFEFYQETSPENDDEILTMSATYVPAGNRVVLVWFTRKDESTTHEVRYAFSDIHTLGWANATPAPSGSKNAQGGGYNGIVYDNSTLPLAGHSVLYLAVKPQNATLFSQINIPLTSAPTGDVSPPSVPTNLIAMTASLTQINLSWTDSSDNVGVTGYKVYRCQGAGCTPAAPAVATLGNVTSYQDTGLSAGTLYRYAVSALDAAPNESGLSSAAQASPTTAGPAPVIFFTDLESGPKTGGENNNGAFVTLYGNNFGTNPSVTVGGGQAIVKLAPAPHLWYQKMVIQLGPVAQSGNVVVTANNQPSNSVPFTVRNGVIRFVGTQSGDVASIVSCKNQMAAGDICYVRSGINQTVQDDYGAALAIGSAGSSGAPIALIAYPGATVTIGNNTIAYGIRTPAIGSFPHWVIAGFNLRSGSAALDLVSVTDWRVVGNDFSCPQGAGQSACLHTDSTTQSKFLGNYDHDSGISPTDKYYHRFYFTTNSNHLEVAWNEIARGGACRGIQFFSTGGSDQFDLHVHDNLVHDVVCDGINFATVNPDAGPVEAYNNVVYHVGTGPDPSNGSANYACVNLGSSAPRTNKAEIYNNTFYDCGSRGGGDAGAFSIGTARLRNNIIYQLSGESYIAPNESNSPTGSNNVWFGLGNGPSATSANINADPRFTNIATKDFTLQTGSPALGAGVNTGICANPNGGWDAGACLGAAPSSTPPPPPPDTTPPVLSGGQPTGTQPAGTTQVTLRVTTSEAATCKYDATSRTYPLMANTFSSTGGTSHSSVITGLANGSSYVRYVRCQDTSGNANTSDYQITFSVNSPGGVGTPPLPPNLDGIKNKTFTTQDEIVIPPVSGATGFNWDISAASGQQPATSGQQPVASGQQPATSGQQPVFVNALATGGWQLATGGWQLATGSPVPTTAARLPLSSFALTPGAYVLQVQATNNAGASPWASAKISVVQADFSAVKVFPNPWKKDKHAGRDITFDNLTANSTVKIFTIAGHLVRELPAASGQQVWDLKNDKGDAVASGVYVYLVTNSAGNKTKGKLAIVK